MLLKILQISQGNTSVRASFLIKTLTQVLSSEFCGIFKNSFFTEHLWTTVSGVTIVDFAVEKKNVLYLDLLPRNRKKKQA